MQFHERLHAIVRRRGMEPVQLTAGLVGQGVKVSNSTVLNWLSGIYEPKASAVAAICQVLDVEPNELLGCGKTNSGMSA